jgi:superfamily II DNA/RNA helicase
LVGAWSLLASLLPSDEIDWNVVSEVSEGGLTIKDLNYRLFLPQRDEAIVDRIRETWQALASPRGIVFCRTIDHAEEFAQLLRTIGLATGRVSQYSSVKKGPRSVDE